MIDTSELKNGDKCKIWVSTACPCGCESEGQVFTRTVVFNDGLFQSPGTYEIYGPSVLRFKLIE